MIKKFVLGLVFTTSLIAQPTEEMLVMLSRMPTADLQNTLGFAEGGMTGEKLKTFLAFGNCLLKLREPTRGAIFTDKKMSDEDILSMLKRKCEFETKEWSQWYVKPNEEQ